MIFHTTFCSYTSKCCYSDVVILENAVIWMLSFKQCYLDVVILENAIT